ncbi:MAG: hypothetical protein J5913_01810 [Prevotella sp.]|nr:hypothetical protein [Prevotella sp.]MBO5628226.1 hypothetical protein [Aeriscardovia sp.]
MNLPKVLDDIYQTAITICMRGLANPEEYKLNKLKKTHPEAFFYLNEIQRMG